MRYTQGILIFLQMKNLRGASGTDSTAITQQSLETVSDFFYQSPPSGVKDLKDKQKSFIPCF